MGKRYTATEKWDKAWFRKLSPRHKSLWQYLCDRCDQVGMWEEDFESASHFVNDATPITREDLNVFGDRLEKYNGEKIWITDFVSFQYTEIKESCPAHKPIFKLLRKYNLLERVLNRLSNNLLEKEKEKEEEKVPEIPFVDPKKVFTKEAQEAVEAICEYFDVTTDVLSNKYNAVHAFVETLLHRNELTLLRLRLTKYMAYKARSQEAKHSVKNWIGTKNEKYYDGEWYTTDWNLKDQNYKQPNGISKGTQTTIGQAGPEAGKDYSGSF